MIGTLSSSTMQDIKYIGANQLIVQAVNGFHYIFPADDLSVGLHLLLEGRHEPWLDPLVKRILAPGHNVAVVGSNLGYWDVCFSHAVEDGRVWSFEPNVDILGFLRKNLILNGCNNCQVVPKAVSDQNRKVDFYAFIEDYGGSSLQLIDANASKPYHVVSVETTLLDAVIDRPLRLLKIDAEGAEPYVLRGAHGLIDREMVEYIVLEHNADYYNDLYEVEIEHLRANGYRCWIMDEKGVWPEHRGPIGTIVPSGQDLLFAKELP